MNKKPKKRAKKLKNLSQAHGKDESLQPTTLDQIWGDTGISVYRTMDENVYRQEIDALNKSDLQSHASKRGLVPVDDRRLLTGRLMTEFRKHVNQYRVPKDTIDNSHENLDPSVRKTLEEGR